MNRAERHIQVREHIERANAGRAQAQQLSERISRLLNANRESGVESEHKYHRPELSAASAQAEIILQEMDVAREELRQQGEALVEAHEFADIQRARFYDIFLNAPDAYLVTNLHGVVLLANREASRMFQRPLHRLEGKPIALFVSADRKKKLREVLLDLQKPGAQDIAGLPFEVQPREGELVSTEATIAAVRTESGAVRELRWTFREVSAATRPAAALVEAHEELIVTNAATLQESLRLLADTDSQRLELELKIAELEAARDAIAEQNTQLEVQIAERRRVEDSLVGRHRDLQRRLERTQEQVRDYSRQYDLMCKFVVEEIGGPLLELERTIDAAGGRQAAAEPIYSRIKGARRSIEAVRRLMAVSGNSVRRQEIDAHALLVEVFEPLQAQLKDRSAEVAFGPDLPPIEGEPELLKTLFRELLDNAVKFTSQRSNTVIEVKCRRTLNGWVWSVRDNGIGFRPEQSHRLFLPFQRLHRGRGFEGAGVGLAIANRIVLRHGGRIWAEANPDQGMTVSFTLGAAGATPKPDTSRN